MAKRAFDRALLCALAIAVSAPETRGQGIGETTGTLVGEVRSESGDALPRVSITVTGDASAKSTISDANGRFVLPYLVPGSYTLRATLEGFRDVAQDGLRIRLNERSAIRVRMRLAVSETMEVHGEAPLIDSGGTTVGTNIPQELIASVPLDRSFTAAIHLSPGVAEGGLPGNPSVSGASAFETTYIVDGVNITETGYGVVGAYSTKFGSLGSGYPPDFVQEVQVMTAGFEPEYGQALGGVVNVITRSGGIRLAGEAFVYWSPPALRSETPRRDFEQSYAVDEVDKETLDGGLQLGGPIVAERLHFFASYNRRREETAYANDPEAPQAAEYPATTDVRTTDAYAFKANAGLGTNHTLELSAFGDPGSSALGNQLGFGLASLDPVAARSSLEYGSDSQVARWSGVLGANLFVEGQVARSASRFAEVLGPEADQNRLSDLTVLPIVTTGGLGAYDGGSRGENLQYSVKATNLWGAHEIRYGAQLEEISYAAGWDRSGPGFRTSDGRQTASGASIFVLFGEPFGIAVEKIYFALASLSSVRKPTSTDYLSLFAQDTWSLTPHLDLRFGVRWEEQRIRGDRAGSEDVTFPDNWAPRVGLSWDYRRDGRSRAFLHYGRFFEKIPNDLAAALLSSGEIVSGFFYDAALTEPLPGFEEIDDYQSIEVEGLGSSTSPFTTRSPYTDEWVAGVEQELVPEFTLGARFIYRKLFRALEDIQVSFDAPCVPGYLGTALCVPPGITAEEVATSSGAWLITNADGHYPGFPKLEREYQALELTAQRRYSDGWQVLGSYRYARLRGNYEGQFARETGIKSPHYSPLSDLAASPWMAYTFDEGPLPNDVEHTVKVHGSYRWELGLSAGLAFNYASGRPVTALGAVPGSGSQVRVLSPRGALGRLEAITQLDLRAQYDFRLGSDRTIAVGVDVFNVFDARAVTEVVPNAEVDNFTFEPLPNPDFLEPKVYQSPRSARILVKFSF